MDNRTPLDLHTVLDFDGMSCHIEEVIGQGSNAIVYKGWYRDSLDPELHHRVLVKELFPYHPQQKIRRAEDGHIIIEPDARDLWATHKESFEVGNRIHLHLLLDHPDIMVMGANLNSFQYNGTLYSVLGYTGGRSLQAELNRSPASLRRTAQWMIGLLDALEAFHKSGYLHLDISPGNVMLVGQEDQARIFLIDYNSARELGSRDSSYLSCNAGYSAPEVSVGNLEGFCFSSDLYSVAAVFFRCLMGRSLTLAEALRPKAPDAQDSAMLKDVPQTVSSMVNSILKKGLNTLPKRRYQSIGQMRQAFQELLDRIDCLGVTHWSVWENGKRSIDELIRINPSLRYLQEADGLYPIRLEQEDSMSLDRYLDHVLSPEGTSGIILAQGGMGKTTLLLHTAMLRGRRYSPAAPAFFYISLTGWNRSDASHIRSQILMRLRFKKDENTYDSAMHALQQLLEQPLKTKDGNIPAVVLLLDGLNEIRGDIAPLIQEINELGRMAGVRILAASRSEIPELELKPAKLMPLHMEDVESALGGSGLLIPRSPDMLRLLQTPLILSIYIRASDGGKQLQIRDQAELMTAYMDSLLEKEIRHLPEDSPQRWQTDAALNYVLPAIAIEARRRNGTLTREQLLAAADQCWKMLDTPALRKAFPRWIGHSMDIRSGAQTPEEWFGIVVDRLLWQRLGMLTRDGSGGYRIFHQMAAEHLAEYKIPLRRRTRWIIPLAVIVLCSIVAAGYFRIEADTRQKAVQESILSVFELGATGYMEYGEQYRLLRSLTDHACNADTDGFLASYDRVLRALQAEQVQTDSEKTEAALVAQSSHDQTPLSWGDGDGVYEYSLLSQLFYYPDEQAAFYGQVLPLLKSWMESEALQEKTPDFAVSLSTLLESDADLAAELYHRAVGAHLSGLDGDRTKNINATIAMVPELDAHRVTSTQEDRGQRLSTLISLNAKAKNTFEAERAKLSGYIRNFAP